MSETHGRFVWYELSTTDTKAATDFYTKVVGWTAKDAGMPGMSYTLLCVAQGNQVSGITGLQGGGAPHWLGYVAVDDVDESAAKAAGLGAKVLMPGTEIPTVGRFSIIADPQGVAICLFKPIPPEGDSVRWPQPETIGMVGWHELTTEDGAKAFDFYSKLFGWTADGEMDMGPMGKYRLFAQGGRQTGGMMNRPPQAPGSYWLYYFNVGDIDAALARVTEAGGQVLFGPSSVPGGGWIVQALDPQGAMFALVGTRA